jgi:hypothetical protein
MRVHVNATSVHALAVIAVNETPIDLCRSVCAFTCRVRPHRVVNMTSTSTCCVLKASILCTPKRHNDDNANTLSQMVSVIK